ncbi:MAG TPA: hypothetical protein VMR52_04240 [Dehalococcoidia bacterium]|nr:hypothetical protein [Dehalococcoidia bacterium]
MTNGTKFSLCPNCDACPEVVVTSEAVTIGEEGNQVRLAHDEWNVLVAAIKAGSLDAILPTASVRQADGGSECCGA